MTILSHTRLITDVTPDPITVAEQKSHSRITVGDDDAYVQTVIVAARKAIEHHIGRKIGKQVMEAALSRWPCDVRIGLPYPPLISVESIKYTKEDGTVVTWHEPTADPPVNADAFIVETSSEPGAIFLKSGKSWPSETLAPGFPIKIKFIAGIEVLPSDLRQALLLLGAHFYENREPLNIGNIVNEIKLMLDYLCTPHTYGEFL